MSGITSDSTKNLKIYAWSFAALPFIYAVFFSLLSMPDGAAATAGGVVYLVLARLDQKEVSKAIDPSSSRSFWWALIPPLYLWKRNKAVGETQTTSWAWFGFVLLSGVVDAVVSGSGLT